MTRLALLTLVAALAIAAAPAGGSRAAAAREGRDDGGGGGGDGRGGRGVEAPDAEGPLTIAVLDFDVSLPGRTHLGREISDLLGQRLGREGARLVEREALDKVLREL